MLTVNSDAIYFDLFRDGWTDVQSEFVTDVPEPEQVYLAAYEYEDYSGDAIVVYRNGDKIYEVTGGHCSCYGLEGQFEPEEYDRAVYLDALRKRAENRNAWSSEDKLASELIRRIEVGVKL